MDAPDPARARIEQLRDEFRLTRDALARIAGEAVSVARRHAESPPDTVTLYGCGALLHGYYTALERILQSVTRDFNSAPPQGADWHRRLLIACASERPGRRPAILSAASLVAVDRYLRFRHLFRNLYVFDLQWLELHPLLAGLPDLHRLLDADLAAFDGFLASLVADNPVS